MTAIPSPMALRAAGLSDDEADILHALIVQIMAKQEANKRKALWFDAKQKVRDLGIALPPEMRSVAAVVGWPATAVEVLEERLDIEGFTWPGGDISSLGVLDMWADNDMAVESGLAHTESLIHGVSFAAASIGDVDDGEPEILFTLESPLSMTLDWNRRKRRADHAASIVVDEKSGALVGATLHGPMQSIGLAQDRGVWTVTRFSHHGLGRPPVVRLVNRPRTGKLWGASEITPPVIAFTEMACRSLLRMEVTAEFYSAPQRWVMGADEKAFVDENGEPKSAWQTLIGRILALSADEHGNMPEVGQFDAQSPAPNLDAIKGLASLLAAEIAAPPSYLGFHTQNPPSGDGIRAHEARLVKRAERRQRWLGAGWPELLRLGLLLRDGELPPQANLIAPVWRDASTPTRAAQADAVTKLVASGVLRRDSDVTRRLVGLNESDRAELAAEDRRARASQTVAAMQQGDTAAAIKAQADALGVLIRAGVDPVEAARRVGLDGMQFTGAVPVSLRMPENEAQGLEEK